VTWLLTGEFLHRDSLGSEQLIKPGQLNLMTAGNGVVHSEQSTEQYAGAIHGVQLWVAQPASSRFGESAFEHHSELPKLELDSSVATVIVGGLGTVASSARTDSAIVGVDLEMRAGVSTVPLRSDFEYAAVVLDGAIVIGEAHVAPGALAYLGQGRDELEILTPDHARVLLLGGEPFGEPVFMWWNFVARSREEVDAARSAWELHEERFGDTTWTLPRVPAPSVPWLNRG
jgi:redox-sensitive bicupin YhaK (pirin superfamily)